LFWGVLGKQWVAHKWTEPWLKMHISVRELYPIVLALELWADQLANKRILFHCNNISVVYCINKQTSKDPDLMRLIRRLVVQALKFHIYFEAEHVPEIQNSWQREWILYRQKSRTLYKILRSYCYRHFKVFLDYSVI